MFKHFKQKILILKILTENPSINSDGIIQLSNNVLKRKSIFKILDDMEELELIVTSHMPELPIKRRQYFVTDYGRDAFEDLTESLVNNALSDVRENVKTFKKSWEFDVSDLPLFGFGFGSALAMAASFFTNHSILWAIVHGLCSWFYVVYYVIAY